MEKTAMILEGGAMRGIYTAGVLDYLMEREYYPDHVIGVSIGSNNAVDYISRQIGRTRDCMALTDASLRYLNKNPLKLLKKKEMFDIDMIFNQFPNDRIPFDYETYFASEITCELVVSNCLTGQAEYLDEREDRERLMAVLAASCSMPYVSHTIDVDGQPYLDGGCTDSVPLIHAMKSGYRKNIVILTRHKGYRKSSSRLSAFLTKRMYGKKYPEFAKTLLNRAHVYNRTMELLEKWEAEGRIFVIRPEGELVSRTEEDYEKLMALYQQGHDQMERLYPDLMAYLQA